MRGKGSQELQDVLGIEYKDYGRGVAGFRARRFYFNKFLHNRIVFLV